MQRREEDNRYLEKLVAVNRVSKTVKGGRNMRFSALMVVGDTENPGTVGCGMGKAVEIPEAIRKGLEEAKKSMITIPLNGTTIPHEVVGVFGTGRVKMLPAPEGTGVIAGGPVRAVLEAAGIKDIVTKSIQQQDQHGSRHPGRTQAASQRRTGCGHARQDRRRAARLRGYNEMKLKITQTKSTIACLKDQIATIKALGLHHIGHTVVKEDNPAIRGMIFKVKHMVKVEEIAE